MSVTLPEQQNPQNLRAWCKVVQHCKNIFYPSPDLLRGVASHQTKFVTPISNWPQRQQVRAGAAKKLTFSQKSGQNQLWMKKYVFLHFNNYFGTHGHIPAIFNFLDLILSALSHNQRPQNFKTYLQSFETNMESFFYITAKSRKSFSLQLKRQNFCNF